MYPSSEIQSGISLAASYTRIGLQYGHFDRPFLKEKNVNKSAQCEVFAI